MANPTRVVIGPLTWGIRYDAESWLKYGDDTAVGVTKAQDQLLVICPSVPEHTQREITLHELMHAIHITYGHADSDHKVKWESAVSLLSPALIDVLTRNQNVRAYIFGV